MKKIALVFATLLSLVAPARADLDGFLASLNAKASVAPGPPSSTS